MPVSKRCSSENGFELREMSCLQGHARELSGSRGKNQVLRVNLAMLHGQEQLNFAAGNNREIE
jgi:hypothetical protein